MGRRNPKRPYVKKPQKPKSVSNLVYTCKQKINHFKKNTMESNNWKNIFNRADGMKTDSLKFADIKKEPCT